MVGAEKNYTRKEERGKTELTVDMDLADEYKDYFMKTFPGALQEVKNISEQ